MNGSILRLIERIIHGFEWIYRYAVECVEEYDSKNAVMVEIEVKSQGLHASEIF